VRIILTGISLKTEIDHALKMTLFQEKLSNTPKLNQLKMKIRRTIISTSCLPQPIIPYAMINLKYLSLILGIFYVE